MAYMIGVDIGTTSTKSVLFTEAGAVVASHSIEYPLLSPQPDVAEQDPDQIFAAVLATIRSVLEQGSIKPEQVLLVSFSSAMHSVIAVDEDGKPLTRSITWADNRSAAWAEKIKREWNGLEIYRRTGTPIHPMSPLSKLVWLRHEKRELFERASKFISIKEYVFFKLFGSYVIDYSIASATGLFNLERLDWDEEALALAGVTPERLSKLVPTTYKVEGLREEYATVTGLLPSTPFFVGASDGVLSNLGLNAITPGVVAVTIGTSGAIRTVTDKPITDPQGRIFCYALTDKLWVIGGAVNNGGVIFRWVKEQLGQAEVAEAERTGADAYELLTSLAAGVAPGSDGLLFHPYLAGERAPLWDANARGSYFGLGLHHKKGHLVRAALEGILYNINAVLRVLKELSGKPTRIHATGGFARSVLWRQMMADIFDQELEVPESFESSCLGAVILGLYGLGRVHSLDVVSSMVGRSNTHRPNEEAASVYRELITIYERISGMLQEEYAHIAAFQKKHV
ncbi:gluconate kinase [Paenibacillus curdlanolyticus]|nr:gluconate kinase [Paenibacillus curdlanolyticus]